MLTIIHGDDIASSRRKLRELVEENKNSEKIFFDGRKMGLDDLTLACESSSMLFARKLVVIENFLGSSKSKNKDNLISYLNKESEKTDIMLWDDKKIDKRTFQASFKKYKEYAILLPANLFKFLDKIGIERKNLLLSMFHSLLTTYEAEMIYTMIIRQLRNMIIAIDPKMHHYKGLAAWQMGKLKSQAKYIGQTRLVSLYRRFLTIDYKIKSGLTPLSMRELLDIFFINL